MTNTKKTKRALVSSVLALFLCFAMLLGTTFAWFTDSVTNRNNIITSGNLDVELWHCNNNKAQIGFGYDEKGGEQVDANTALFLNAEGEQILWEPGASAGETFRVKNVGSLALKFQLQLKTLNATKTEDGKDLTDILDVQIIELVNDENGVPGHYQGDINYDGHKLGDGYVMSGELLPGETADFNVAIDWVPSENDNDYNVVGGLQVDLAVDLLATQMSAESDAWGNTYDKDAWVEGMVVADESSLKTAISKGETNILLMQDITLTETFDIPNNSDIALNLNGKTLSATLTAAEGAVLINNGTATISNGTITSKAVNGAEAVVNNGTMVLADVTINGAPMDTTGYPSYAVGTSGKLTIEEGTKVYADRGGIRTNDGAELIINGGEFIVSDAADGRNMMNHVVYAYGHNTTVTINGGYFEYNHTSTGGASVVCPYYATIIVNGGDFRDAMDDNNWTSVGNFQNYMGTKDPVVYGGTYDDKTVLKHVADGYQAIENNGVYYVVADSIDNIVTSAPELQAALDAATGDTLIIMAADINGDVTVSQKDGVNIVLDGKNYKYDGTIYIDGNSRNTGAETLTIQNVNFETSYAGELLDFISANDASGENRYAHNVTIEDCTFTNNGTGTVVPARFRQAYNITIKNCTVEGTFSPLWTTGVNGLIIDNLTANCADEGMTIGASDDVLIENCTITVPGENSFGIRTDATANYELTVNNCTLNVAKAIVIRGSADTYKVMVDGVPFVATSNGLKDAIANGATNVNVAQDMTISGDTLSGAASNLTVNVAANTSVTVASGAATSKDLTVTGDKSSKVVLVNTNPGYEGKLSYQDNANLTFKGITFDANQISGICARGGVVTFVDCHITGELMQTIGSKFVFSGCTFDVGVTQVGYGCPEVVFENCIFETDGYGIKIYKESNEKNVNLTVKGCSFKNTGSDARSAILLDHILDGFTYNITIENCKFEGYTTTPTATYNKWAERMIVTDSFVTTDDGQYIFSYQTGAEGGSYHKILTTEQLVVTVK